MANNIEKLLSIIANPAQAVEDALQQLKSERFVDTAIGEQLDIIGRIVGQDREGLSDDDYRRYIRARIAANNSDGTIEDLLTVAFLVVYDEAAQLQIDNQGVATVVLRVNSIALTTTVADILVKFLGLAATAGVRVILEYCDQAPATWFKWDTPSLGWDNGKLIDAKDTNGVTGS